MKLFIKKLRDDARVPTRAHADDAGIDLYACGEYIVAPGETIKIPSGVAFEIEEGYVGLVWDKGSVGSRGIKTLGGVLDSGYRGELFIVVNNLEDKEYIFKHGDKVAQLLIQKVEFPEIVEAAELSDSERGAGAFGSTGK